MDQNDPPHKSQTANPGYISENQKKRKNLEKRIGIIDKIKRKKVRVGRQYSSAGYNPKRSCFHLAAKTEKHATLGFKSRHSLSDFAFQCPPPAQGINSKRSTARK